MKLSHWLQHPHAATATDVGQISSAFPDYLASHVSEQLEHDSHFNKPQQNKHCCHSVSWSDFGTALRTTQALLDSSLASHSLPTPQIDCQSFSKPALASILAECFFLSLPTLMKRFASKLDP